MKIDLSYKNKSKYLIITLIIILYFMYKYMFYDTINLYNKYENQLSQTSKINNAPILIKNIEATIFKYDSIIGEKPINETSFQNTILEKVSGSIKDNDVFISDFSEPINVMINDYNIVTVKLVLRGNYISLLKVAWQLEKIDRVGFIPSMAFETKNDFNTKSKELFLTIYLQNFVKTNKL